MSEVKGTALERRQAKRIAILTERLRDLVTDDEGMRDRSRPEYQERLAAARAAIGR